MQLYPSGTRIAGRYEVAGQPLLGGMGIVYFCFDHGEQRPVALKTFKPEFLPDRAARDRFLQEGETWVRLGKHPHIVRCYRVFQDSPRPEVYLALELIAKEEGRRDASLRAWLTPGRSLPLEQVLLIALQIVRGMQHAAETIPGFVHRDLKPENVLVGADRLSNAAINRARITDFGLVRIPAAAQVSLPSASTALVGFAGRTQAEAGTPEYMAPEQWERADVDVQADIYAFGCILGEMLVGRMLVHGQPREDLWRPHQAGQALSAVVGVPTIMREVLARCLAVARAGRYENWLAVEQALSAAYTAAVGRPAPAAEPTGALSRAERVVAGWSVSELGFSLLDIGRAKAAIAHFHQACKIGEVEGERGLVVAGLSNLGVTHMKLGYFQQALQYYEQALTVCRELSTAATDSSAKWTEGHGIEGNILSDLGETCRLMGDAHRAITYLDQALKIHREIGHRRGQGYDMIGLGMACCELGDTGRGVAYMEQALAIHQEIGHRRGEGYAIGNLGHVYLSSGNAKRAIEYCEQALSISREIGDRLGEILDLANLGSAYLDLGDTRRAGIYFDQVLAISREAGDRRREGVALVGLGSVCSRLGDARQAARCLENALSIHQEIGDRDAEGQDLGELGDAYLMLGDVGRAISQYEQALALYRKTGNRRSEARGLGSLGNAQIRVGNAEHALRYHEQSLAIRREIGDRQGEGYALGNLGAVHLQLGEIAIAVRYCEQALAIRRDTGDRYGESNDLGNLAGAYSLLGDAQRAIEYYEQALTIHQEIGNLNGVATIYAGMAEHYFGQGELAQALLLAQEAVRLFSQMGDTAYARRAQQLVVQLESVGAPAIFVAVAAAQGDNDARSALEEEFGRLTQQGWRIAAPIRRIWAGERDAAKLTAGIDANSALIVREILKRL